MLPVIIGGVIQILFSSACIMGAWTLLRFVRAQKTPKRFPLIRWVLWLAAVLGPTGVVLFTIAGYALIHDWRHSEFGGDLGKYRQIARDTVYEKIKGAQPGMYGPRAVKPKLLVMTVAGWVDDGVQSQIGAEGRPMRGRLEHSFTFRDTRTPALHIVCISSIRQVGKF